MITFYDIPSTVPGLAWSPNTWKTRYSLNFKGIPYETVWVEYPDIEATCKKIGAVHTQTRENGRPLYTLPMIHDASTGAVIIDSVLIAEYLDATYPDTPKLLPPGTRTLQRGFMAAHHSALAPLWQLSMPATIPILNTPSQVYFKDTKFGPNLRETALVGKEREEQWAKLKDNINALDGWMQKGEADGPYIMGGTVSFSDFALAGYMIWLRKIWGEDSAEWVEIKGWHEGRWETLLNSLQKYEAVL